MGEMIMIENPLAGVLSTDQIGTYLSPTLSPAACYRRHDLQQLGRLRAPHALGNLTSLPVPCTPPTATPATQADGIYPAPHHRTGQPNTPGSAGHPSSHWCVMSPLCWFLTRRASP